ncbi:hypothetical protein GCM10008905_12590 [Clostridium malenominatum]|uniref:Uncharacterized protein n=1 Tax=Clostridium malenominatum TaxID=1539 RepID=A0ABP3U545_9CLOT
MVAFKKMWNDVEEIISKNTIKDFYITEKCSEGFVVKDNADCFFVGKQDFVDFWCNMLYFKEISLDELNKRKEPNLKYVCAVIKHLPYIKVNSGVMKVLE